MPSLPAISNFPATLDDVISLAEFMDLASTTLADPAVTASSTTFNAPDTSRFSATGLFTIEGEHVRYTGKTPTSFTGCTREVFQSLGGFSAAPHPAGAIIEQLNIAALHAVLRDAVIAAETKVGSGASTPTSGQVLTGGTTPGTSAWGTVAAAIGYTPADAADTNDDVEGPSASTDGEVALYGDTTGKLLKRSNTLTGFLQLVSGVASAAALTLSQITTALGFTPANKAGDTFTGNVSLSKADASFAVASTNAGNSQVVVYDTTDGGVGLFNQDGTGFLAKFSAAGAWVSNIIKLTTTGVGILGDTPTVPLEFPDTVGCKIALWGGNGSGTSYGIGVESAEMRFASGGVFNFKTPGYNGSSALMLGASAEAYVGNPAGFYHFFDDYDNASVSSNSGRLLYSKSVTGSASITDSPGSGGGVIAMSTGATVSSVSEYVHSHQTVFDGILEVRFRFLFDVATSIGMYVGICNTFLSSPTTRLSIRFETANSDTVFFLERYQSSAATSFSMGLAPVANVWYQCQLLRTAPGGWSAKIIREDNGQTGTASCTGVSSSSNAAPGTILVSRAAANRTLLVDYCYMRHNNRPLLAW